MSVQEFTRRQFMPIAALALGATWLLFRDQNPSRKFVVPEVDPLAAKSLLEAGALVIDVRNQKAFDARHLPNAVLISLSVLELGIPASLAAAKEKQIVVYCNDGARSGPEATHILQQAGFKQAANLRSGIEGWVAAGLAVTAS